jgi:hypothetical protein
MTSFGSSDEPLHLPVPPIRAPVFDGVVSLPGNRDTHQSPIRIKALGSSPSGALPAPGSLCCPRKPSVPRRVQMLSESPLQAPPGRHGQMAVPVGWLSCRALLATNQMADDHWYPLQPLCGSRRGRISVRHSCAAGHRGTKRRPIKSSGYANATASWPLRPDACLEPNALLTSNSTWSRNTWKHARASL